MSRTMAHCSPAGALSPAFGLVDAPSAALTVAVVGGRRP